MFGYGMGTGPAEGDGAFTTIGKGESSLANVLPDSVIIPKTNPDSSNFAMDHSNS